MMRRRFVNRHARAAEHRDGRRESESGMGRLRIVVALAVVIVLAAVGGFLYLAYGDFSVPSKPVERVLPDARFPR